jgi:hypothetical protein
MSRNLTAGVITEITAGNLRPIILVAMQFSSGWVYLWSGTGTLSWNGQSWTGTGYLGKMEALTETQEVEAQGVRFSLSGVPNSLLTSALQEVRQGNPVIVYQGFLTAADAVVSSPYQAWAGRMDSCEIEEGGETSTIYLIAESRLIDLKRSRERRFTHDDQQIDFSGDLGFEFVPAIQEKNVIWGGSQVPIWVSSPGGWAPRP